MKEKWIKIRNKTGYLRFDRIVNLVLMNAWIGNFGIHVCIDTEKKTIRIKRMTV